MRLDKGGYLSSELFPLKTDRFPEAPIQPYPLQGAEKEVVLQRLRTASAGFATPLPALTLAPILVSASP